MSARERPRLTAVVWDILSILASASPDDPPWGLRICERTGRSTGTIYPALDRLTKAEIITGFQEDPAPPDRPRRHFYEITSSGREWFAEVVRTRQDASLATDYENGVADVLAFLAGNTADVNRNVNLPGRLSKTKRQIDVLLRGQIFGFADAMMIVDCKRWGKPIDVADAGTFLDMVEDVGAELGLLVTTVGASPGAQERLRSARGARVEVMTLGELAAWRPPGTFETLYRVPRDRKPVVENTLRRAGFRVMTGTEPRLADDEAGLSVFRHYGTTRPSPDVQRAAWDLVRDALAKIGIGPLEILSYGIVADGGTPAHRWLEVSVGGMPIGLKIVAATEAEAAKQLESVRSNFTQIFGMPVPGQLDVIRPEGWPIQSIFGRLWS
jgi:DNA-binding PadR family transcriptional regulator